MQKKRDGPESRTVVMMPERKRQKMEFVQKDLEFIKNYYMESMCRHIIQMDLQNDWHLEYNCMTSTTRSFLYNHLEQEKKKFSYLFNITYKSNHDAVACLRTAKI